MLGGAPLPTAHASVGTTLHQYLYVALSNPFDATLYVFGLEAEVLYKDVHVGQAQHREDSEIESCAREFLPPALGPRDSPRRLRTTAQ